MKSPTKSALKYELASNLQGQIVSVSNTVYGSTHDLVLTQNSGVLNQLAPDKKAIADKGYVGNLKILTPPKRNSKAYKEGKENARTRSDTASRKELATQRVEIENINARMKMWKIMGGTYRGDWKDLTTTSHIVAVVAALCNLRMQSHPIRRAE